MARPRNKFEAEVHLGFLVIVSLLLLLNFVSNFVVYRARSADQTGLSGHLRQTSLAISRAVQQKLPQPLSDAEVRDLAVRHDLSDLIVIPSQPAEDTRDARRQWFATMAHNFPPGELPRMAEKLVRAEYQQLTRGDGDEYFYVYPMPVKAGRSLLVLTVERANLAYLDDSRKVHARP